MHLKLKPEQLRLPTLGNVEKLCLLKDSFPYQFFALLLRDIEIKCNSTLVMIFSTP